jgi:hypothetical protein
MSRSVRDREAGVVFRLRNKEENHYYGFALSRSRFAPGCVFLDIFSQLHKPRLQFAKHLPS